MPYFDVEVVSIMTSTHRISCADQSDVRTKIKDLLKRDPEYGVLNKTIEGSICSNVNRATFSVEEFLFYKDDWEDYIDELFDEISEQIEEQQSDLDSCAIKFKDSTGDIPNVLIDKIDELQAELNFVKFKLNDFYYAVDFTSEIDSISYYLLQSSFNFNVDNLNNLRTAVNQVNKDKREKVQE